MPAPEGPSRRHWNVEPGSLDENEKLELAPVLAEVIVVSGGVVSPDGADVETLTLRAAERADTLRAMSVARAVNVRVPSVTPLMSRDQAPPPATTVPRELPFSKISTVEPLSAVPVSVNAVPTAEP